MFYLYREIAKRSVHIINRTIKILICLCFSFLRLEEKFFLPSISLSCFHLELPESLPKQKKHTYIFQARSCAWINRLWSARRARISGHRRWRCPGPACSSCFLDRVAACLNLPVCACLLDVKNFRREKKLKLSFAENFKPKGRNISTWKKNEEKLKNSCQKNIIKHFIIY